MGCSGSARVTTPALVWLLHTPALAPRSLLLADPNARIRSSSTPAPALTPDTWIAPPGVPKPAGSPQRREQSRESFSLRSHFIIVAKETSSQDLAWNMSASAGPHIHLSQSALRAGAGADKGGDGGGGSSGTTAAALNRPARAGCAARKSCQGSYKDKNQKNHPNGIWNLLLRRQQGQEFVAMLRGPARRRDEQGHWDGSSRCRSSPSLIFVPILWRGLMLPAPCPPLVPS